MTDLEQPADTPERKSKSQRKREMEALQQLGKRLTELNSAQLEQIPLPDPLLDAIRHYQRFHKREAGRRQLQLIGRLMRDADATAITQALHRFDASHAEHVQHFHTIEVWRDRLLTDDTALTEFVHEYPDTDIQRLRQLIRNADRASAQQADGGAAKKLFRYIRELLEDERE